jgi:hypothetical protein
MARLRRSRQANQKGEGLGTNLKARKPQKFGQTACSDWPSLSGFAGPASASPALRLVSKFIPLGE